MLFQQIYLGCLAQASYLIGSDGVAAVVDPRRDVDDYLDLARQAGLRIAHVVLTHAHADFVAGHVELAERTGAKIWTSWRADCSFEHGALHDGDGIVFGHVTMHVLETPGHTPDGICLLVRDASAPETPAKLLTGDTLFLGDVGRPDLVGALGYSAADMAGMLYDSLHKKILPLADDIEVWPGHGAGSACGRNISSDTSSTLGRQRLGNPALQPMTREQFIHSALDGLGTPPAYFQGAAAMNRRGPLPLANLPTPRSWTTDQVVAAQQRGAQVLDPRSAAAYGAGHLPGSINIGLSGQFESWCGTLLDLEAPIVLAVTDAASAHEARLRLARIGLEQVDGFVELGDNAPGGKATLSQLTPQQAWARIQADGWQVLDVRRPAEFIAGHAPGAHPLPIDRLAQGKDALASLPRTKPLAIICGSGYRSSAAAYFLRRLGFNALYNIAGGTSAWIAADLPLER